MNGRRDSFEIELVLQRSKELIGMGLEAENAALLRKARTDHPESIELCLQTAIAVSTDAPEEADELLRTAARLADSDPNLLTRCANLMLSLGALNDAEAVIKSIGGLAPQGGFILEWEFVHHMGRLALLREEFETAEQALSAAFRANPAAPEFGEELARLYKHLGRADDALAVIDEALEHNPDDRYLARVRHEVLESSDSPD